jgi:hypothetical protein
VRLSEVDLDGLADIDDAKAARLIEGVDLIELLHPVEFDQSFERFEVVADEA